MRRKQKLPRQDQGDVVQSGDWTDTAAMSARKLFLKACVQGRNDGCWRALFLGSVGEKDPVTLDRDVATVRKTGGNCLAGDNQSCLAIHYETSSSWPYRVDKRTGKSFEQLCVQGLGAACYRAANRMFVDDLAPMPNDLSAEETAEEVAEREKYRALLTKSCSLGYGAACKEPLTERADPEDLDRAVFEETLTAAEQRHQAAVQSECDAGNPESCQNLKDCGLSRSLGEPRCLMRGPREETRSNQFAIRADELSALTEPTILVVMGRTAREFGLKHLGS